MTNTIPHVRLRDGVFQFERRVPLRIQRDARRFADQFGSKPLYRLSLRTKDEAQAMRVLPAVKAAFERMIADQPVTSTAPLIAPSSRTVTDDDLAAIVERYRDLTSEPFERLHRRAPVNEAAAAELERLEYQLGQDAEAIQGALRTRSQRETDIVLHPANEAQHVIDDFGFNAPPGSEAHGAIIAAVRTGFEQGYDRIGALSTRKAAPRLTLANPTPIKQGRMTLADAVELYLEARQPPAKAASETKLALNQFEEAVGRKALAATTRNDFHIFVEHLANKVVGGKSAGSVVRHLSKDSIQKRLNMLRAAIKHVRDRGLFDGENVTTDIRVATFVKETNLTVMPEKRRFQISEMNAIFQHPWFTGCKSSAETHAPGDFRLTDHHYWAPVVAAMTGCRAGELGGLRLADVRLDHPQPHLIIRNNEYRRTKSKKTRCIPVLDALLTLGFDRYVERMLGDGHDRLFPNWTARKPLGGGAATFPAWSNSDVIRAFNRTVIPRALADTLDPTARREVTFHAFRGAFKAMLGMTNNLPVHVVNEVIGHAKSELDTAYIGELTIEETYPLVRVCRYDGLQIPSLV